MPDSQSSSSFLPVSSPTTLLLALTRLHGQQQPWEWVLVKTPAILLNNQLVLCFQYLTGVFTLSWKMSLVSTVELVEKRQTVGGTATSGHCQ